MSIAAPTPRAQFTRDDIVRLGQAGRPWDFLPIAAQALKQVPDDVGLRLITASNLVRLGLKTAAADHLSLIPEAILNSPEVQGLVRVVRDMAPDAIATEERVTLCRANLGAFGETGPVSRAEFDAWAGTAADSLFCRATDGNVISRPANGTAESWRNLSDQRLALSRLVRESFTPSSPDFPRPLYLEGIDPPWLLMLLAQARRREQTGHLAPITIVQAQTDQFLDGLSLADLRPILSAGNIAALVGAEASTRLGDHLSTRAEFQISGPGFFTLSTRSRCSPTLSEVLQAAVKHQEQLHEDLSQQATSLYKDIDWRVRFTEALSGGEPLRILIPTTRYSTFLQHASRDLARTFEALGHRARILIEPDDFTKFASPSYLDTVCDFRPDLIVLINYPRAMLGDAIPRNIPFICWIQDAMPHLFSASLGAAQSHLDFVVGHLFDELFNTYGYPRERSLLEGIIADDHKFHTGPVPDRSRFECEIAYVSHQSETPQAQHSRLVSMFKNAPHQARAIERLRPILQEAVRRPVCGMPLFEIQDAVAEALRAETGAPADPKAADVIIRAYCHPYLDRLIRHQTLEWAAAIADRRGWRLKVHGNGWEGHPRLAQYAAGSLQHGDDLRGSYQCAGTHLHMTAHSLVHQRLIECIFSGGFPLCRLHCLEQWGIIECLTRMGVRQGAPPLSTDDPAFPTRAYLAQWADAPALLQLASGMQRLELFDGAFRAYGGSRIGPVIAENEWRRPGSLSDNHPTLWSAFLALGQSEAFLFHSEEQLERRIEFALNQPRAKTALVDAARRRLMDRFTYSGFARRLLCFVQQGLPQAPGAPS